VNSLLFSVRTADVLTDLSRRSISNLSPKEIEAACQEVKAILETELDIRP
jgi:sensor histidine kinase regulating citrate/malate metabolism